MSLHIGPFSNVIEVFRQYELVEICGNCEIYFDPLNTNPTKWSNTLKQFVGKLPTNCLSVFDHFVKLEIKWLKYILQIVEIVLSYQQRVSTLHKK